MDDKILRIRFLGHGKCNLRNHLDFGPLVGEFTVPLELWGMNEKKARIRFSFERPHEHEANLTITVVALAGVGAFGAAFCAELGKKLADKIWNWAMTRTARVTRHDQDNDPVILNADEIDQLLNSKRLETTSVIECDLYLTPKGTNP